MRSVVSSWLNRRVAAIQLSSARPGDRQLEHRTSYLGQTCPLIEFLKLLKSAETYMKEQFTSAADELKQSVYPHFLLFSRSRLPSVGKQCAIKEAFNVQLVINYKLHLCSSVFFDYITLICGIDRTIL